MDKVTKRNSNFSKLRSNIKSEDLEKLEEIQELEDLEAFNYNELPRTGIFKDV